MNCTSRPAGGEGRNVEFRGKGFFQRKVGLLGRGIGEELIDSREIIRIF